MSVSMRILISVAALPFIIGGATAIYRLRILLPTNMQSPDVMAVVLRETALIAVAVTLGWGLCTNRWQLALFAMSAAYLSFWLGLLPLLHGSLPTEWAPEDTTYTDRFVAQAPLAMAALVAILTLLGKLRTATILAAIPSVAIVGYTALLVIAFNLASKTGVGP